MTADDDLYWMQYALQLADKAEQSGEIPVGAVLVKDGVVLGEGWIQSIQLNDPSAHAEMIAIRQAAEKIGNYRLTGLHFVCHFENLVHVRWASGYSSRVKRLVFGAKDAKTGAAGIRAGYSAGILGAESSSWMCRMDL